MGQKQLKTLLIVFAVLAVAVGAAKMVRRSSIEASLAGVGERVLPDFPINDVAEIGLSGPGGKVTLKRKAGDGNVWTVAERGDYRADFSEIGELLREVWELEVVQNVEAGPSQFGRLGLLAPDAEGEAAAKRGTLLEFKKSDGEVAASLLVGKEEKQDSGRPSPFGTSLITVGRYVKPGGSDSVSLVSHTLASAVSDPAEWINKDFFRVGKLKSIERKSRSKHDDWKLARKSGDGDWKLLFLKAGEELDDSKIGSLKSALSSPRFDDVATGVKALGDDASEFVLTTFDGFTYKVRLGKELEDRKHHLSVNVSAKLTEKRVVEEDESEEDKKKKDEDFAEELEALKEKLKAEKALAGRVYVVPNFVAGTLLKKRSEITKTPDPPAAATPAVPGLPGLPGAPGAPGANLVPKLPSVPVPSAAPKAKAPAAKATAVTDPIKVDLPDAGKKKPGKKDGE